MKTLKYALKVSLLWCLGWFTIILIAPFIPAAKETPVTADVIFGFLMGTMIFAGFSLAAMTCFEPVMLVRNWYKGFKARRLEKRRMEAAREHLYKYARRSNQSDKGLDVW